MVSEIPGLDISNKLHERMLHVLNNYDRSELFHFLVQAQKKIDFIGELKKENQKLEQKCEEAKIIMKHWNIFKKHLEKNPSLKEEWDNLCMAIKLTEE